MAGLTLGGLASGMDTNTIITQLMQIEAQSQTRLLGRQYRSEQTKTVLDQVATRLRSLSTAATGLGSIATWGNVQNVTSSDAGRVGVRSTGTAAVGTYSVEVTQLARADQRFYGHPAAASGASQITINGVAIDVADGSTVDQTAAAINAKSDSPAYASVVDGQLVLSGKQTGVELTVSSTVLTEDTTKRREQRNAIYSIDGVLQPQSPTNTVANALPGVELTLKGLTSVSGPATVDIGTVGPDEAKIKSAIKSFVDAYNSAVDLIKSKTEETKVRAPQIQSDYGKGVLRGDPGLLSLRSQMRQLVTDPIEGDPLAPNSTAFDQLAEIGITLPGTSASKEDRLAGKLTLDEAKLTEVLTSNPDAVRRLLGGVSGVEGFAQKLTQLVDPVAKVSEGSLAQRAAQTDRETARLKDQMSQMDARLKLKEERLRKQFTAMETALNSTQSTTSWLSGQIAGLATWSSSS